MKWRETTLAILCIVFIMLLFFALKKSKEGFVSKEAQELYKQSHELFERTKGNATYTAFEKATRDTDPVIYSDVRNMWKSGKLTPENVQSII